MWRRKRGDERTFIWHGLLVKKIVFLKEKRGVKLLYARVLQIDPYGSVYETGINSKCKAS